MGATFGRLKDWVAEVLTYSDLNAEIDNILDNLGPAGVDDFSTNVAQMKLQTDPGGLTTESLPNSLSGEIERLRFAIARIAGETFWYETPASSISELTAAVGGGIDDNRIASGRIISGTNQPAFLVPHGTNPTVSVQGGTTNLVYYIAGIQYIIDAAVTSGTLVLAPSTNNTCLVNDGTLSGQEFTRTLGENESAITVDAMGSEITALIGKYAAFKVGTEYFTAFVESATSLTKARRGFFFDSADAALARATLSDNASISLMKMTYVFAKTDETLTQCYTVPFVSFDQPTGAAIGDYWFDLGNDVWKYTADGSNWATANATLIGMCVQDTSGTKAARSFDFFANYTSTNTFEVERTSNTQVKSKKLGGEISVYGQYLKFNSDTVTWDITADLDSGVTESASKTYYLYLKDTGDKVISDVAPQDRLNDLKGLYHTHKPWRAVGEFFNDGSSNIVYAVSYGPGKVTDQFKIRTAAFTTTPQDTTLLVDATSGAITVTLHPAALHAGRELTIIKTDSSSNAVTIDASGSETINGSATYPLGIQYEQVELTSNGTAWFAPRKIALGQQLSSEPPTFSTTSASFVDVTNLTVTITTTGRPVFVGIISTYSSSFGATLLTRRSAGSEASSQLQILRDATVVALYPITAAVSGHGGVLDINIPASSIWTIDIPSAGTYTYKVQSKVVSANSVATSYCKLIAYEL
jgi:hypothetical protein